MAWKDELRAELSKLLDERKELDAKRKKLNERINELDNLING